MSIFWRKVLHRREPWHDACVAHDFAYWQGGFSGDRLRADLLLYRAVRECGYPVTAFFMFAAVRVFGASFWPFPWRWGFRYRWPRRRQRE